MKKKKFLALLLTGAMALAALTGCSSGTETTEESTGGDASAESGDGAYKIALIQQHQTNAFQIGVTEGAQAKADELGVELNILSADQDAAKQISQIEQCVSEGYDAILFEPVDPDGLRDAAKAAADAGVIMINIVSACTDWESAGISAVSCGDNVKDGRITGTVAQDGGLMASSGVEAAVTLLDGGTLENNLIIADSVWIDSSNVADYE